jgi:hypothetical protein
LDQSKSETGFDQGRQAKTYTDRSHGRSALTEARVIIPGAQALLGFQLSVTLMRAFQELAESTKIIHIAALCCIAFTHSADGSGVAAPYFVCRQRDLIFGALA